ncbi:MAG: DUF2934 domain-containing protein [Planctomycetes bacterium]|nr:DUF2934 domain-containing protein [Planctomycetota bacterium]
MAEKTSSKKMAAAAPKKDTAPTSQPKPAVQQSFGRTSGATSAAAAPAKKPVDAKERYKLIAETAYYLAQKRNFAPGHEVQDWTTAEKQVDAILAKR